jgi:hypothetical protein
MNFPPQQQVSGTGRQVSGVEVALRQARPVAGKMPVLRVDLLIYAAYAGVIPEFTCIFQ